MVDGNVAQLADSLWQAEVGRTPISPITDANPGLGIEDAYAIQSYNIERRVGAGRVVRGRTVGLASGPMQELLGVSEPPGVTTSGLTAPVPMRPGAVECAEFDGLGAVEVYS